MTDTPGAPPDATRTDPDRESDDVGGPRVDRDQLRDLSRLRRTTGGDRTVAGVAGGLGRHLDVDPVILKVVFVVLAIFGGGGLLLYAALWLLLPDDRSASRPLGLDDRARGIALVVVAVVAAFLVLGAGLGPGAGLGLGSVSVPVLVLGGVALLIWTQVVRRRETAPRAAPTYPTYPPPDTSVVTTTSWPVSTERPPGFSDVGSPGYAAGSPYAAPPAPLDYAAPPYSPAPAPPRRTGPILFWFTLALGALALGVLGVADLAGLDVARSAYPALALAVIGVMLLVGAFWGRAGGLVLLGLVAALNLAVTSGLEIVDRDEVVIRPTTTAELQTSYDFGSGRFVVDLRGVQDPASLLGTSLTIRADTGRLTVLLPDALAVSATGSVAGPGVVRVLGSQDAGFDVSAGQYPVTDTDSGEPASLTIDARLDAGELQIATPSTDRSLS